MSQEKIDVKSLTPKPFEPRREHRWIFAVKGIDAFCVKDVQLPAVSRGISKPIYSPMMVTVHDAILEYNIAEGVVKLISEGAFHDATLKYLDPEGVVVGQVNFRVCYEMMQRSVLDYARGGAASITVTFVVEDMSFGKK